MAHLAMLIAQAYGVHPAVARQIRTAAALHDVGKLKLPAELLNKPAKLEPHEFEVIKTHTVLGAEMLNSIQGGVGEMARNCCRWHHERFDGSGYWGRRTDDLPFYVPIISICDVAVALLSERPYKEAWPPNETLEYIKNNAGKQFSPELVEVFLWTIRNDNRVPAIFTAAL